MAIYSLAFNDYPVSVNNSENKESYKLSLLNQIKAKYNIGAGAPAFFNRRSELYVLLVFFYKDSQFGDFDNYLKYTVDAFKKCIYADDKSVKYFQVYGIPCNNASNYLDASNLDEESLGAIIDFVSGVNDEEGYQDVMGYFECGEVTTRFYNFRLGEIWR